MLKTQIALGTLLACASTAALAQGTAAPVATPPANAPPAAASTAPAAPTNMRAEIMADLKKAGYTDVKVTPGSYVAQAKDKAGDPVTLFIGPETVTEVVLGDPVTEPVASAPRPAASAASAAAFTSVPAGDGLTSKLVGTDVYNKENKDIGAIKDIAFAPHGAVKAYIVGVGGFLGMGDHYVAVRPSAMAITWNASAKKWHVVLDTNADTLKKAPEFKYPS